MAVGNKKKLNLAKEVAGVLALVGARLNCKIGLLAFSNENELVTKTAKGKNHFYSILSRLIKLEPKSKLTSIDKMLRTVNLVNPKRSIIFIISDFLDDNYQRTLSHLASKHDVIAIHVDDVLDGKIPALGIMQVQDSENGRALWLNSSFGTDRNKLKSNLEETSSSLDTFCKRNQIDYLRLNTEESYTKSLIQLFQKRNRYWKK